MGRGRSAAFKRMCGSKVCPGRLAQQRGRLPVAFFILFSLSCITWSVSKAEKKGHLDFTSDEDGLTAEVLIVIVGARGRRGGCGDGEVRPLSPTSVMVRSAT